MTKQEERLEELKAFLGDRFAEAIRQPSPKYADESFDLSKYYVDKVIDFLKGGDESAKED